MGGLECDFPLLFEYILAILSSLFVRAEAAVSYVIELI